MFCNDFWLFVVVENEKRKKRAEKSFGKWILFFDWDESWEQWKKIAAAIEDNHLDASSAKISRQRNDNLDKKAVICVYTYENNIDLVRKQLFDLGFKKLLCFKKNDSTEQNSYGHPSHLKCEKK